MRKFLIACVIIVTIFQVIRYVNAISWRDDFDQAVKDAAVQNKPLMVYFYTTWCGYCSKFDGNVLHDWTVKKLAKDFICVKVNAEENKSLASRYQVTGFPTVIFLDKNADIMDRRSGYGMGAKFAMKSAMKNALRKAAGLPPQEETGTLLDLL